MTRLFMPGPIGVSGAGKKPWNKHAERVAMKPECFFLIDGNALAYQSFYAFQRQKLTNPRGEPVGALYGFLRKLFRLLETHHPDFLYVVFDSRGKTDNHQLFADYKANRKPMPDELSLQIRNIKSFLDLARIKRVEIPGHEADDIIGTIVERVKERGGCQVVVYTPDKDLLQLIDTNVTVVRSGPKEDKRYDRETFEKEFGFPLRHFTDYLALMGDSADNIPGVKGIGPKGAKNLIHSLGDVEAIIDKSDTIANPRARDQIKEQKEMLLLSKKLVVINRDIPMEINFEEARFPAYDPELIRDYFNQQRFLSLMKYVVEKSGAGSVPSEEVVFETGPFSHESGEYLLMEKEGGYLLGAVDKEAYFTVSGEPEFLERPGLLLWIYDAHTFLKEHGAACEVRDLRLLDYWAHDSETPSSPAEFYDRRSIRTIKELREYFIKVRALFEKRGVWAYLEKTELRLPRVIKAMEERGVKIDTDLLNSYKMELEEATAAKEKEVFLECGEEFNIRSPKQLGDVLFEKMAIKIPGRLKRTKTGYATDESVLQKVASVHPVGEMLLEYRKIQKILSTYILPYLDAVDERGRLHSTLDYCGTATGRLSSKNPNLQNIPIYGEWGKRMRQLFVADDGYQLVSADYSQMELRIMAHYSGDENLISIFREGGDIHSETARRLFGTADQEMRHRAKAVNFGIIYGQSAFSLSSQLGISLAEAEDLIRRYFERFSGVRAFIDRTIEGAREKGWVAVLSGRRRRVPGLQGKNRMMREAAKRVAVNTPIQGSA
ncbi:MAG TPA: hypothetical protein ENL15_00960, partial [Firmicutes bacterium]|nr:hypothetical protein [Bacillota bacterium]